MDISVRWFDKNDKVIAQDTTYLQPRTGRTSPFHASTDKNPEIARYDVTIQNVN